MNFNINKYEEIKEFFNKYKFSGEKINNTIIAVSKTRKLVDIQEALRHGVRHFGEIRVNEAIDKFTILKTKQKDIQLHMLGAIQSNKVKNALKIFDYFHSLDRNSLAIEFSKYPVEISSKYFFIQVNTGNEMQKSGIYPNQTSEFINYCKKDLKLNVIGLMCLPPVNDDPKEHFLMLRSLAENNNLKQLSMGMSGDYKIAIACGATHIRIGTSFFGYR